MGRQETSGEGPPGPDSDSVSVGPSQKRNCQDFSSSGKDRLRTERRLQSPGTLCFLASLRPTNYSPRTPKQTTRNLELRLRGSLGYTQCTMGLTECPHVTFLTCNAFISVARSRPAGLGTQPPAEGRGNQRITPEKANQDVSLQGTWRPQSAPLTHTPREKQLRGLTKGSRLARLVEHLADGTQLDRGGVCEVLLITEGVI